MSLDVPRGCAHVARLDDEPQDGEAHRMTEGAELFGVAVELGGHAVLLTNSKKRGRAISIILEIMRVSKRDISLRPFDGTRVLFFGGDDEHARR